MISKEDCSEPICFFCRENVEDQSICFVVSKNKIVYQKFGDPKYVVNDGYWKEKCSTPIVQSTIVFHQQCWLEVAGEEYQFSEGTKEDPLIIL